MGTGRTTEFLTPIRDSERKRVLLRDRRADVLAAMPGAESLLPTIEHAALLVEDDLCLVRPDGVLAAACLCAPSHWVLADKLGRPIADVHRAVPYYRTELARRVDTFLSRLRDGQVVGAATGRSTRPTSCSRPCARRRWACRPLSSGCAASGRR